MRTFHESTIQRHIYEGGDYDENDDGSVTLYRRGPNRMTHEDARGTGYDECFCDGCYFGKACEVKR